MLLPRTLVRNHPFLAALEANDGLFVENNLAVQGIHAVGTVFDQFERLRKCHKSFSVSGSEESNFNLGEQGNIAARTEEPEEAKPRRTVNHSGVEPRTLFPSSLPQLLALTQPQSPAAGHWCLPVGMKCSLQFPIFVRTCA